jgi:hypothetical protein
MALLPCGSLKQSLFGRPQSSRIGFDRDGTLPEHYREEDARGAVRPGGRRVTAVPVVQNGKGVPAQECLPSDSDWNDRRAEFFCYCRVCVGMVVCASGAPRRAHVM